MSDGQEAGTSVGSTLLILVFTIAMLTAFAVLALVSANGEHKLVKKNEEILSAYYAADSRGEEQLRQMDGRLSELWEMAASEEEYYGLIKKEYGEAFEAEGKQLVFKEVLNENLRLNIILQINVPLKGEKNYRILSWNTEVYEKYQGDKGIGIWTEED